jgi:hypothetical protein
MFWDKNVPHCHSVDHKSTFFFEAPFIYRSDCILTKITGMGLGPARYLQNYSYILTRYWFILFLFTDLSGKIFWPNYSVCNNLNRYVIFV